MPPLRHTRRDRVPSIVALQSYGDDDYLIFDCPGQIELYSHATVFRTFVDWMRGQGWSMCAVYCLDCQFVSETPKFIAGSLQALAAMVQLELPHVNVLTKVDLVADKVRLQRFSIRDLLTASPVTTLSSWPSCPGFCVAHVSTWNSSTAI